MYIVLHPEAPTWLVEGFRSSGILVVFSRRIDT